MARLKFVLISDTHMQHTGLELPEGDILIHAGDFLGWGTLEELTEFCLWIDKQAVKFQHVILVAGNHDRCLQNQPSKARRLLGRTPNLCYLEDSGIKLCGVEFWGSPWTTEYQYWAFMRRPGPHMDEVWAKVPKSTQVLVTHSPPFGILDRGFGNTHVGCEMLTRRLGSRGNLRPRLHVFGHSHSFYGQEEHGRTLHCNASLVDNRNFLVNRPMELELTFD